MSRNTGKSSKIQTTVPGGKDVSRRRVLSAALGAVPGLALANLQSGSAVASQASVTSQEDRPLLEQPHEIRAENGVLNTSLEIQYRTKEKAGLEELNIRMYGYPDPNSPSGTTFKFPGPTLRVRRAVGDKPGDSIKILLKNNIEGTGDATSDSECNSDPEHPHNDQLPNCFHGNNVTNFHFHGFHISPEPPSDDVFLKLQPGEEHQISVDPLPANQAEGTHWYHPHKHGSTALQVLNGMAGAFIVEGPFDDELNALLPNMQEVIFIVQDIGDTLKFPPEKDKFQQKIQLLVNGQLNPTLRIRPGEIQRWRFIGATMHTAADSRISFGDLSIMQIAQDGVQFAPENYGRERFLARSAQVANQPSIDLAPGNRVDVLVKAPMELTGTVPVFATSNAAEALPEALRSAVVAAQANTPLFTVVVTGLPRPMDFPTQEQFPKLPSFLADITPGEITTEKRTIAFQMIGEKGTTGRQFCIGGKRFDPGCVDQRMQLNATEEWTISNDSNVAHPCHIHVNPFQLVEYPGRRLEPPWIWMDTIALPPVNSGGPSLVKIRHRFLDFEGKYVMHCHILGHEDRGMMQVLEVGDTTGSRMCQPVDDPTTCPPA